MYKLTDSGLRDSQFPYKNVGIRGRVSYGYDQRYIGEVAFAYEGSDLYARAIDSDFFLPFHWVGLFLMKSF